MVPSDPRGSFNNVFLEVERKTRRLQNQAYLPIGSKLYHFPTMVPIDPRGSFNNKSKTSVEKYANNKNLDK